MENVAMSKMFAALAAVMLLFVIATPGPADAAQRRADGMRNLDQYEFSSARRRYRRHYRRYAPRYYYRPYYYRPSYYQPYTYGPYYYRPYYYRPAPWPFFPFYGPRYWW